MRITLTGRRLALAAVLVLAGVAAPLAYSALGKSGNDAARPLASPVGTASLATAQAPTSSGDNPYQFHLGVTASTSTCPELALPPGVDFVLESVSVSTLQASPPQVTLGYTVKVSAGAGQGDDAWEIPLDSDGDGTRTFNLLVRPDAFANAAVGDIHALTVCVSPGAGVATVNVFLTGQRVVTAPTASSVVDFQARRGPSQRPALDDCLRGRHRRLQHLALPGRERRQGQPDARPGEAKRRAEGSELPLRRQRAGREARLDLPAPARRPEGQAHLVRGLRHRRQVKNPFVAPPVHAGGARRSGVNQPSRLRR
jgi:hypothetical protein